MKAVRDLGPALRVLLADIDPTTAWRLGATVGLVVVGGLLAGLAPLALKGMIDAATVSPGTGDPTAWRAIAGFGVAYLLVLSTGRLLAELRPTLLGTAEQRLYTRLRRRVFAQLLDQPLGVHLARQSGAPAHALQQAISGYQVIAFTLVNGVVPVLAELSAATLVLMSLQQPALTACFAATALAYLAVLALKRWDLTPAARAVSEAGVTTHALLSDALLNCETIKCFGAEATTRQGFERATSQLERCWSTLHQARWRMGLAVTLTFALSLAALLAVALHGLQQGSLTLGGFVLAQVYLLQVVRPLEMLGTASRDLSQAMAFVRPLLDLLAQPVEPDRPPIAAPGSTAAVPPGGSPGIRFRGVRFAYEAGHPVLDGLDLDIAAGRTVAIVGASGCGKSSLVRLLLRLHEPQAGEIQFGDVAIDTLPIAELRARVAIVPQDTVLFNDSIAFNIGIGKADATRAEIERAARVAGLHEHITRLPAAYETRVGDRGLMLSGGERQRVAIARAVLKDPQVYVFDEATSMLDSATEAAILHQLQTISKGRTTVMIAHRLSTVQHADEIVVLDRGRVVERGAPATLRRQDGPYAALWRAQRTGCSG